MAEHVMVRFIRQVNCKRETFFSSAKTWGKRKFQLSIATEWMMKDEDPPGFKVQLYHTKGRGVKTTVHRHKGDFLLVYCGEIVSGEEGEKREALKSTGFRFFYSKDGRSYCIDATEESSRLCRLVNHGDKNANAHMKNMDGKLVLFALKDIDEHEEILCDYGVRGLPWQQGP
ncbi:N-lysine methyltransferase KMT5A-like [Mercenaria mercenaria]|uniref:N-lysine methyltransferase KMT5A-like n=1 Tax=Mercenaria mercenaria TaxID=6596 RepID=UPI00234F0CAE|nr:N-lysine methyltransferase KMT5A-like [Mercenaria mercenaria]